MKRLSFRIRLFHLFFLFWRPMTLGVRILVTDDEERVLMVRHGYVKGWHLPGGGVERGETALAAAAKELEEETGLQSAGSLELLEVYANRRASKRDHVLLYRCSEWERVREFQPNREIVEIGFFAIDQLPADTTEAVRMRIEEVFLGREISEFW